MSWNFFFHFQQILSNEQLNLYFEAKLSEYLKFFITLSHVSTLISQVFTIIFLYIKNMTNYLKFIKKNKKLIFFIFILLATIITPPEVFSQLIVGSFIVICYEIIVIIILFLNVNKVIR
jgi:sec-independent protein translocase protein TatC